VGCQEQNLGTINSDFDQEMDTTCNNNLNNQLLKGEDEQNCDIKYEVAEDEEEYEEEINDEIKLT